MIRGLSQKGAVLIFALWVLAFLTIVAVSIAAGIKQKILVLRRLDDRSRQAYLLEGAAKKARGYIREVLVNSGFEYTPAVKVKLHNNPQVFSNISLAQDAAAVSYVFKDGLRERLFFGVRDEESKININYVSKQVLAALVERVLNYQADEALRLAEHLLDWRQHGESQAKGFFADDYYAGLQFPYPKKDADYENLHELLLVKGMNKDIFEKLIPFITVYGEGKVNINTASPQVLFALGLDDLTIDKILQARRGHDEVEATGDDFIFTKTYDVAGEVNALVKLEAQEIQLIDAVNAQGFLTVKSSYFSVDVTGQLAHRQRENKAKGIYSVKDDRFLYWHEK